MRFRLNQAMLQGQQKTLSHNFQSSILQEHTSDEAEAHRNWGRETVRDGISHTQEFSFSSNPGNVTALQDALDTLVVPGGAGELELVQVLPFGNALISAYAYGDCSSMSGVTMDVNIIRNHDDSVILPVAAGVDVTSPFAAYGPMDPMSPDSHIKEEDHALLVVKLSGLPTDDDGNTIWKDPCGLAPCIDFKVHVQMRDLCHRETVKGCPIACCPTEFTIPCVDKEADGSPVLPASAVKAEKKTVAAKKSAAKKEKK